MGEELLKGGLYPGDFGVSDPGRGIAGNVIEAGQLYAIDVVLVEFRTPVKVMQVIRIMSWQINWPIVRWMS